jgi:tetratricopeptide (TPR) repeat protein
MNCQKIWSAFQILLIVGSACIVQADRAACQTPAGQQPDLKALFKRGVELERAKNYPSAARVLEQYLEMAPNDPLARCLLLNVYVRSQRKPEAIEQLAKLDREPIPQNLVSAVSKLRDTVHNFELERSLDKALLALRPTDAMDIIDQMSLNTERKELLKYYVDLRQGNLASALLRSTHLTSPASPQDIPSQPRRQQLMDDAAVFSQIQQRVNWYRYSALTNGTCTADWIRKEIPSMHYEIQKEFVQIIANSQKRFPLNSWVLDHAFLATLLSDRPYEDLESLGDKILEAKGDLRIPFYSGDALFDLVIDGRTRHIKTEPDGHVRSNESGSDKMPRLLSFDVAFDDIRDIDQKASMDLQTGALTNGSYALRLEPGGLAPRYAFMDAIQCLDGEAKQKAVTRNLGQFIAHVVRNSGGKVHLVDPAHKTVDWIRATSTTFAIGTMAGAQVANVANNGATTGETTIVSQEAMKVLAENKKEAASERRISLAQQEEQESWHEELSHVIFSAIESQSVQALTDSEDRLLAIAEAAASR